MSATLLTPRSPESAAAVAATPLLPLVGADLAVPVTGGGRVRYVNLDNAATTPALQAVADRVAQMLPTYASVHRGAGYLSTLCSDAYESARATIAAFVGARPDDATIITRNTTDALNLLATAVPGAVVCLDLEHHANLLPWAARVVPARDTLVATLDALRAELRREPAALLAVTGASNVTGECLPLAALADLAHEHGARLAVDGAQLVPHRRVDLAALGVDYLAFSGHKLYAPFGAGVLVGRRDWLDAAPPYLAGGGAVRDVRIGATTWKDSPARHEGGTPNLLGAVALATACRTLAALAPDEQDAHEAALLDQLATGLSALAGVRVLQRWPDGTDRVGVVVFVVDGRSAEEVATVLADEYGIGVRHGRFCAHPLLATLVPGDDPSAVRASVGVGSRTADVVRLLRAVSSLRGQPALAARSARNLGIRPEPKS